MGDQRWTMLQKFIHCFKAFIFPISCLAEIVPSHWWIIYPVTRTGWTWMAFVPMAWQFKMVDLEIHVTFNDPWNQNIPTHDFMSSVFMIHWSGRKNFAQRVLFWPFAIITCTKTVHYEFPHFCFGLAWTKWVFRLHGLCEHPSYKENVIQCATIWAQPPFCQ